MKTSQILVTMLNFYSDEMNKEFRAAHDEGLGLTAMCKRRDSVKLSLNVAMESAGIQVTSGNTQILVNFVNQSLGGGKIMDMVFGCNHKDIKYSEKLGLRLISDIRKAV